MLHVDISYQPHITLAKSMEGIFVCMCGYRLAVLLYVGRTLEDNWADFGSKSVFSCTIVTVTGWPRSARPAGKAGNCSGASVLLAGLKLTMCPGPTFFPPDNANVIL